MIVSLRAIRLLFAFLIKLVDSRQPQIEFRVRLNPCDRFTLQNWRTGGLGRLFLLGYGALTDWALFSFFNAGLCPHHLHIPRPGILLVHFFLLYQSQDFRHEFSIVFMGKNRLPNLVQVLSFDVALVIRRRIFWILESI